MILLVTIFALTTGGVYMLLQRSLVQAVFGIGLISHAANFILLSSGVLAWRAEPLTNLNSPELAADPLPQAFVLTSIVITMAVTILMLALAVLGHNDDIQRMPQTGETHDT